MKITDIQNLVDQLCSRIDDLGPETAADLPGQFTELAANLEESGCLDSAAACLKAAELAGQVFREETEASHGQQVLARTMEEVRASLKGNTSKTATVSGAPAQPKPMAGEDARLIQEFVEEANEHLTGFTARLDALTRDPRDTAALAEVIRGFHTITGMAGYLDLNQIKGLAKRTGDLLDMVRNQEATLEGGHLELILESTTKMKALIQEVAQTVGTGQDPHDDPGLSDPGQRPDEMANQKSQASAPTTRIPTSRQAPARLRSALDNSSLDGVELDKWKTIKEARGIRPDSTFPVDRKIPGEHPATLARSLLSAPAPAGDCDPGQSGREQDELVRIRAERLDQLVEAIGDLVVAESLINQSEDLPRDKIPVGLAEDLENLSRVCRHLQKIGTSLELVPIKPLFREMEAQMGRLAEQLGKDVDLVTAGQTAELDQRLLARLRKPLATILTSCLEDGIEAGTAQRQEQGKPGRARLGLTAIPRKDHLTLEIQDDGTGRNEKICADPEVRRAIEQMQGTLTVAAEPGQGCKFIIRLPLNPNLTEGLIIKVGSERCILPAHAVLRLIRPQKKNLIRIFNQNEMIFFEGEAVPLVSLTRLFGQQKSDPDPSLAMVVVAEAEGRRIGLLAEELLGYQSIVVKKLNQTGKSSPAAAGAAITTDGGMALVLDVPHLVQATLGQETAEAVTVPVGVGQSDGG